MSTNLSSLQASQAAIVTRRDKETANVKEMESAKTILEQKVLSLSASLNSKGAEMRNAQNSVNGMFNTATNAQALAKQQISSDINQRMSTVAQRVRNGEGTFASIMAEEFSRFTTMNYFNDAKFSMAQTSIPQALMSGIQNAMKGIASQIVGCQAKIKEVVSLITTSLGNINICNKAISEYEVEINNEKAYLAAEAEAAAAAAKKRDPYEVQIDGDSYMFIKDSNNNGKADDANEILGINDTTNNRFAEMKGLDANKDGKVSKDELVAGNVKLVKVNAAGQLTNEKMDMNKLKEINLNSFNEVNAGDYKGTFEVKMADNSTAKATSTFKDDGYFDKLFSGNGQAVDPNAQYQEATEIIANTTKEKVGINIDIIASGAEANNDVKNTKDAIPPVVETATETEVKPEAEDKSKDEEKTKDETNGQKTDNKKAEVPPPPPPPPPKQATPKTVITAAPTVNLFAPKVTPTKIA